MSSHSFKCETKWIVGFFLGEFLFPQVSHIKEKILKKIEENEKK